jgi:23S rRNA (pseudouridine1915-N3)-methyltransferase
MSITLITVGKMKEKPYRMMADEYLKRLSRYGKVEEIELPDLPEPQNSSPAIEAQIKEKEGDAILARIKPSDYVIAMTIPGKQWDSPGLSQHIDGLMTRGVSNLVFVIGGSLGVSEALIRRADMRWKLSDNTFPHQLCRIIVLEQIYRSFRILHHEPYHK